MKHTSEQMKTMLNDAAVRLKMGGRWKHYKGGVYVTEDFAISTDTGEVLVLYRRIDGPEYDKRIDGHIQYARPLSEWFDQIDNAREVPVQRFTRVEKQEVWVEVPESGA